ncbi:unnamed protein product [Candidula unifasciata]|uniref:E2F-associated phosphoprotein n=1 Tax=Candidula unifasciata TaxID=100452 RepID=A0A8S3ZAV4_9EUPU|nr:unnamed protein product [Candidula unifasciata]
MTFQLSRYYDGFVNDSSSDDGGDTSSEDEIDIILHGTPEQRRKLQLHHRKRSQEQRQDPQTGSHNANSSSEDEFEKEMNAELSQQVKVLEDSRGKRQLEANGVPSVSATETALAVKTNQPPDDASKDEFYDEIYFDSDEEDDATNARSSGKPKRAVISNDDLLYDPDMDDEDQKWVDKQRLSHRAPSAGGARNKKSKKPNSDALLDCPACMTTLCIDCQRHEVYKHQYRAMFVMNCTVDKSEVLQYPEEATKKKKKNKKKVPQEAKAPSSDNPPPSDMFNPVRCSECNTVVGVIDQEGVYHFFNILASYT